MEYLRKMRENQQSEPTHLYTYINPFSRNPGTATALATQKAPIEDSDATHF